MLVKDTDSAKREKGADYLGRPGIDELAVHLEIDNKYYHPQRGQMTTRKAQPPQKEEVFHTKRAFMKKHSGQPSTLGKHSRSKELREYIQKMRLAKGGEDE